MLPALEVGCKGQMAAIHLSVQFPPWAAAAEADGIIRQDVRVAQEEAPAATAVWVWAPVDKVTPVAMAPVNLQAVAVVPVRRDQTG